MLPIQPIWPIFALNWLDWQCCLAGSSKTDPRILIFSIAMVAYYSFEVKSIEICSYRVKRTMWWYGFARVKTPQFRLLIAAGKTRQTTEHSSLVFLLLLPVQKRKSLRTWPWKRKDLTLAYFSYSILCRRFAPRCVRRPRVTHLSFFDNLIRKISSLRQRRR